jgi:hypothetical protein
MSSELRILETFNTYIIQFFEVLTEIFPEESDLIVIQVFLRTQLETVQIVQIFNTYINKNNEELKKMIHARNDKFFLEHNLFDVFGVDKVNHFKTLWNSKVMTDENKECMWMWVTTFVQLGDAYMKIMKNKSGVKQ